MANASGSSIEMTSFSLLEDDPSDISTNPFEGPTPPTAAKRGSLAGYKKLLQLRPYAVLLSADMVSLTGDWLNYLGTVEVLKEITTSSVALSGLLLVRMLPPLLLSPVTGVASDRLDRRYILILSNFLRMLIVLLLIGVKYYPSLPLLYSLVLLQFSVSAFFEPSRAGMVPVYVPKDLLIKANSIDSAVWSGCYLIGSAIGGVLASELGVGICFLINSATYLVAALILLLLLKYPYEVGADYEATSPKLEASPQSKSASARACSSLYDKLSFLHPLLDVFPYLLKHPGIFFLIWVKAFAAASWGALSVAEVELVEGEFLYHGSPSMPLGFLYAACGLTGIVAPFLFEYLVALGNYSVRLQQLAIVTGFIMEAVGSCVAGWAPELWILIAGSAVASAGSTVSWVFSSSILQVWTAERFRGRVFGFDIGLCTFGESISIIIAGAALDMHMTPREAAVYIAGLPAFGYALWWIVYFAGLSPRLDRYFLDRPEKYSFLPKDEDDAATPTATDDSDSDPDLTPVADEEAPMVKPADELPVVDLGAAGSATSFAAMRGMPAAEGVEKLQAAPEQSPSPVLISANPEASVNAQVIDFLLSDEE